MDEPHELIFEQDRWPELARVMEQPVETDRGGLPLAVELRTMHVLRDSEGRIRKTYQYPRSEIETCAHYLRYLATEQENLRETGSKRFLLAALEKAVGQIMGSTGPSMRFLEIGSTIGENFHYLKRMAVKNGWPFTVRFVGVEKEPGLNTLARLWAADDRSFFARTGDGSDLRAFPDRAFHVVFSNAVPNHTDDPVLCLREMARVAARCVVLKIAETGARDGKWLVGATNMKRYYIPSVRQLLAIMGEAGLSVAERAERHPLNSYQFRGGESPYFIGGWRASEDAWVTQWTFHRPSGASSDG